jgi:hypothetical protein
MAVVVMSEKPKEIVPPKKLLTWMIALVALLSTAVVGAENRFTDILLTKSFRGSWEEVQSLGWLGAMNSTFIMVVCVVGLITLSSSIMWTMLFFGGRNFWQSVWDFQEEDSGSGWLGFKGAFDKLKSGSRGVGVNAIIQAAMSVMPNVLYYSEMNPNRLAHNLKETDSMGTWLLKTFIPKALMIFFFSAGFDGSLMRGYYTLANGMAAVGDRLVSTDLEGWVAKKMNTGEAYTFTLGSSGEKSKVFGEKIAKELYSKVLGRSVLVDSNSLQAIGLQVETTIYTKLGLSASSEADRRKKLQEFLPAGADNSKPSLSSDSDMDALNYTIEVNTNSSSYGSIDIPLNTLFGDKVSASSTGVGSSLTAHITIRKSKTKDGDFLVVPKASSSPSKSGQ